MSSKRLLGKMSEAVIRMDAILDKRRDKDTMADFSILCWAMIELTFKIQIAVMQEFHGLEEIEDGPA